MRNRRILLSYLSVFFSVVYFYDSYRDNTLLVILAVMVISLGGLAAWVWSVQPKKKDKD
jgi:membrane protein DedA with SNARE-associated domain